MTPEITQTLLFAGGGLVGSACRAALTTDQATISKKSIVDLVVGGLTGIIYPLLPFLPMPEHANILQQAAFIAVVSYATGDMVQSILGRTGKGPDPQPPPKPPSV